MTTLTINSGELDVDGDFGVVAINVITFTANGTYTPNDNLLFCHSKVKGAGGGGAGTGDWQGTGAGGGEGALEEGWFLPEEVSPDLAITVGIGGPGGNNSNDSNGYSGSISSFGSLLTANAGGGGQSRGTVGGTNYGAGGVGGIASDHNNNGEDGEWVFDGYNGTLKISGKGGGKGGGKRVFAPIGTANSAGLNATGPGCGGSGAVHTGGDNNQHWGGDGANGFVTITEYVKA